MFSIVYKKSFVVKSQFDRLFTSNLIESSSMLWFFSWDALISKHCMWQNVLNLLNFLSQASCMISSHHDKTHDFLTLFVFLILKPYDHMFEVMFSEQGVQFFSFHRLSLKQGWIILILIFYSYKFFILCSYSSNLMYMN